MTYEHGPLRTYEITWRTGHVEQIQAHQVSYSGGESPSSAPDAGPRRIAFHGEFDGHWLLVLAAFYSDLMTVRLLPQEQEVDQ